MYPTLKFAFFLVYLNIVTNISSHAIDYHRSSIWSGWGGNILNNRFASSNTHVHSHSISSLKTKCHLWYSKGVSATPVISGKGIAYYPTWNGLFVALDYASCHEKWTVNVTAIIEANRPKNAVLEIAALVQAVSRTSPQIDEHRGVVYFGTLRYALLVALDLDSGKTLGAVNVNSHPAAAITQSPTVHDGVTFIGSSSSESAAAARIPGYQCCTFVGNFAAFTFNKKKQEFGLKWDVKMIPDDLAGLNKWSGMAIWGSQPSIDIERNQLFVASGNTYTTPSSYATCLNQSQSTEVDECLPESIWQDTVLAIDIDSGDINWIRQVPSLNVRQENPAIASPDADFGMAPALVRAGYGVATPKDRDVVVLGQKNGNLFAIDAETGGTLWATVVGPGGGLGGLSWGIAVDNHNVYYTVENSDNKGWELKGGEAVNGSFYGAVNLRNGKVVWETVAPGEGVAFGPPSVVGDVVVQNGPVRSGAGGLAVEPGALVLLDKRSGRVLRSVGVNGPVHGGAAVQGKYLLFGTGYQGYSADGSIHVLKAS